MNIDEEIEKLLLQGVLDSKSVSRYPLGKMKKELKSLFRDYIKQGEIEDTEYDKHPAIHSIEELNSLYSSGRNVGKKAQIEALLKGLDEQNSQ